MRARGTTLLELVVTIAIGSMVFLILAAVFLSQGKYFAIENAIAQTQYNAFQSLDTVGLFAGSADKLLSTATINGTAYATDASTVVLELPSIDASGAVISNAYDDVAFGLDPSDPTHFIYAIEANPSSARTSGTYVKALLVDKLIFRYNTVDPANATAIDMYIRTSTVTRGQTIQMPLGKIFYLGSS